MAASTQIKDTTNSVGTGSITLNQSPPVGMSTFSAIFPTASGLSVPYAIASQDGIDWEIGFATFSVSSPTTLVRTTVNASSNSGSLVNFCSGSKDVYCVMPTPVIQGLAFLQYDSNYNVLPISRPSVPQSIVAGASSTISATAAVTIPANSLVYIKSDSTCDLANATAEGKEAVGFVTAATSAGSTATIYIPQSVWSGLSGLTPGSPYYMSTTSGALATATAVGSYTTGNVILQVGIAITASSLLFRPNIPITL